MEIKLISKHYTAYFNLEYVFKWSKPDSLYILYENEGDRNLDNGLKW